MAVTNTNKREKMLFKYYTADLRVFGNNDLLSPSITIKTWFFRSPLDAVEMMQNQLESWDFDGHKIFNLRRIK